MDSYELKLARLEVVSEEECRFTGGCCTLYFRIENHKSADPNISKISFKRFLKPYTDEKTGRAYANFVLGSCVKKNVSEFFFIIWSGFPVGILSKILMRFKLE